MLQLKTVDLKKTKTETLVIPVCEDTQIYDNSAIVSIINKAKKLKEFKGEKMMKSFSLALLKSRRKG